MVEHGITRGTGPDCLNEASGDGSVWNALGHRLEQRRVELGYSAERVARQAGISVEAYVSYESGAPMPASTLARMADALDRPVVWFFDGIVRQEEAAPEAPPGVPAVYTVATVEHRIQVLAATFRKLDLEGQQHVLAISRALARCSAGARE